MTLAVGFSTTVGVWTITAPSSSVWHHLAVTYDGASTSNVPLIYVDGVSQSVTTATTPVGTISIPTQSFNIGNRNGLDRAFNGRIAEFAVWNGQLLSPNEITALWRGASPLQIRSAFLLLYAPLYGNTTNEMDWSPNHLQLTVAGPKRGNHAPVQMVQGGSIGAPAGLPALHAMGDSITAGQNASSTSNRYVNLISSDKGIQLINRGVSGQLSCDMADTQVFPLETPISSQNIIYTEMIGTNDANTKGAGSYEAVYNLCLNASLSWLAVPSASKKYASACTASGSWAPDTSYGAGIGRIVSGSGQTLSCTITTTGGPIYAWYRLCDSCGGTFTYALDGGSTTSINNTTSPAIATQNGGAHGEGFIRITGVAAGSHTVLFTTTNASAVSIAGIGTPPTANACCKVLAGGVPYQQSDANSAATSAYNADVSADVTTLSGDGLNIAFVPVRSYVNSTTDMSNSLHPNDTGMGHFRDAFEASWP